jgi:tetratricopeptide (TPR) repeat protein
MTATHELAFALQRVADPGATAVLDDATRKFSRLVPADHPRPVPNATDVHETVRFFEQAVAVARRDHAPELPAVLVELAYGYEVAGDPRRSLDALVEAIGAFDNTPEDKRDRGKLEDALDSAANMAFEVADRTTDKRLRAGELAHTLALLDRLAVATAHPSSSAKALRGRVLLAQEKFAEALPLLRTALAEAEAEEPRNANRIAIRAFSLAQALWETGGQRDRDRAHALVDQARGQLVEAKAAFERDKIGAGIDQVNRRMARVEAWQRAHR